MSWEVLFIDEFEQWLSEQKESLQEEIMAHLLLLQEIGPSLGRPKVDTIEGSDFINMKELRIQYKGDPWRLFFIFDPKRNAIMLTGGCKKGKDQRRWYKKQIDLADKLYKIYLEENHG